MDDLIKKLKKMVNEESNTSNNNDNMDINSNLNSLIPDNILNSNQNQNQLNQNRINTLASNNTDFQNNNINNISQKNYCETQIDKPFTVSEMKLSRSRSSSKNKGKNHRFARSLSEENNLNNQVNNLSLISKTMYLEKENQDTITNLLTKTLAHIKSNKNNSDINLISNNINKGEIIRKRYNSSN